MTGRLFKVEGAGNDFLVGTCDWARRLSSSGDLVRRLCHRRHGVGADGVLALTVVDRARVRLQYRNRDGSDATFCANGTRCAARAAVELLDCPPELVIETAWAAIPARVDGEEVVLDLPPPERQPRFVSLAEAPGGGGWLLDVGVPHLVVPVDDPATVDLEAVAPALRHHPALGPAGANVHVVGGATDEALVIRSWERGVEGETLCCGSGVVAAGLVAMAERGLRRLAVRPLSGEELLVEALEEPPQCSTQLTGPARLVAEITPAAELIEP